MDSEASNARKRKVADSKASGKRNRKRKRAEAGPRNAKEMAPRKDPGVRFVPGLKAVNADFSLTDDAPVASTAYVGLLDKRESQTWTLSELVGPKSKFGFTLVEAVPGCVLP